MIAMLVCGWVLLPVFALWDIKYAKRPVIAQRFLFNRTVVCAAWIGFFDFVRARRSVFRLRWLRADAHTALVLPDIHVPALVRARHEILVRFDVLLRAELP